VKEIANLFYTTLFGRFILLKFSWSWKVIWKKALRETQTLCTGCSKAEPEFFAPLQIPFPGAWDSQNLINWRWSLPSPADPVWWRLIYAISRYRGNKPTNKQTGPITIHCAAKLIAQCNNAVKLAVWYLWLQACKVNKFWSQLSIPVLQCPLASSSLCESVREMMASAGEITTFTSEMDRHWAVCARLREDLSWIRDFTFFL